MNLEVKIRPVQTPSYAFNGAWVITEREVVLPVSWGRGELRVEKKFKFLIFKAILAYNIILGRPALNEFQAVTSTYHMSVKYATRNKVYELERLTSLRFQEDKARKPLRESRDKDEKVSAKK